MKAADERLPDADVLVIGYNQEHDKYFLCYLSCEDGEYEEHWYDDADDGRINITHWAHLPHPDDEEAFNVNPYLKALTPGQINVLIEVYDGADCRHRDAARIAREIEKRYPELIEINGPQNQYEVDEKLPYLGAICTAKGRAIVDVYRKGVKP